MVSSRIQLTHVRTRFSNSYIHAMGLLFVRGTPAFISFIQRGTGPAMLLYPSHIRPMATCTRATSTNRPSTHTQNRIAGAQFDGWLNIIQRCVVLEDSYRCIIHYIYLIFFSLQWRYEIALFLIIVGYFGPRTPSKFQLLWIEQLLWIKQSQFVNKFASVYQSNVSVPFYQCQWFASTSEWPEWLSPQTTFLY